MLNARDQSLSPKPTVVIHTNNQQLIAALVGAHSLKSRSKHPDRFDVRLLRLEETPLLYKRDGQKFMWTAGSKPSVWLRRDLQSFAPLRRMVPALLDFAGRALVIDPDVFAIGDVYELLSRDMDGKAILCRQRPPDRDGVRRYSSAVMLLDCAQLKHWQWERDIEDLFAFKLKLAPWLTLLDESPERIGLFEEEWNQLDKLTENTMLLHNTEIPTQPWKTGLPLDYHEHAPRGLLLRLSEDGLKSTARRFFSKSSNQRAFYRLHPDPRQEQLFFTLLKECLEQGSITEQMLRKAIRKKYVRRDAFELLDKRSSLASRSQVEVMPFDRRSISEEAAASVAQTNLQLYNQLLEQGRSLDDLALIRGAYKLASLLYSGYYQGDGKPFVCHGIGVASIVARLGLPAEFVAVGLIHNIYSNGDFGDGMRNTVNERRRKMVRRAVDNRVAMLTERFHSLRITAKNVHVTMAKLADLDSIDRNLLILDLADALEKYVDLGVLYFGDGEWIKEATESHGDRLIEMANRLDQPVLAEMLKDSFAFAAGKGHVPEVLRQTGGKYLELVVPLACHKRQLPIVREGLRRAWRRLRSRVRAANWTGLGGRRMGRGEVVYERGDEIDFSDPLRSRPFLGKGWHESESWGVWSNGPEAELRFPLASPPQAPLILRVFAHGFVRPTHPRLRVGVWMSDRLLTEWTFAQHDPDTREARWWEAAIPHPVDRVLAISLTLDAPASPAALGESDDRRQLGLALHKLIILEAGTARPVPTA